MTKKSTKQSTSSSLNFRPQADANKNDKKGNKPLPDPTSVQQVLLLMIVHLCRKVLFIDPNIKVGVYILLVFFGSILGDVLPIPPTYFSRKDNFFNIYFVKLSWGWTMTFVGSFVYLSSSIYTCGDPIKVRKHLLRLIVATINWFFWTKLFVYVEERYINIFRIFSCGRINFLYFCFNTAMATAVKQSLGLEGNLVFPKASHGMDFLYLGIPLSLFIVL